MKSNLKINKNQVKTIQSETSIPSTQVGASWDCKMMPCSCSKHPHHEQPGQLPEK